MTDLKTSLVIVDEVHGIDRSRASHVPEVAAAQRRLERIAARRGPAAVMRTFELAT